MTLYGLAMPLTRSQQGVADRCPNRRVPEPPRDFLNALTHLPADAVGIRQRTRHGGNGDVGFPGDILEGHRPCTASSTRTVHCRPLSVKPYFAMFRQLWQNIAIVAYAQRTQADALSPGESEHPLGIRHAAVPARAGVAWLIWTVGVTAYILTVMQRTTLAAAGLDAADRFGLSPGTLAAFVFIQVAVFSAAQIPAGLLVDRYGPRAMLVANGVLACGQILLANATSMPVAAAARVLVGTGDAIVFAATLALIPRWFFHDGCP